MGAGRGRSYQEVRLEVRLEVREEVRENASGKSNFWK
jgi:hypothetical protein